MTLFIMQDVCQNINPLIISGRQNRTRCPKTDTLYGFVFKYCRRKSIFFSLFSINHSVVYKNTTCVYTNHTVIYINTSYIYRIC